MPIRVLDAATVGRIAAGEVVERPSSVAKELIENALDAGSTSITIEMREGGTTYLRVTDNGSGIAPGEVRMAFENHATSKIIDGDDLSDIRTLGFRGEALPSIAAVGKIEVLSRRRGENAGVRCIIEGGRFLSMDEAGCPEGTTIVVRDLFFNVPVRRAFLKKPAYEAGVLAEMVMRLMLGNPKVAIRLINNGRTQCHSFGDGSLRHAALAVYGRDTANEMIEIDEMEGGFRLWGLIGVGNASKSNRSQQSFYINGRLVRCALLAQALEEACKGRVTIGMHPMCALNVQLPPHAVDVNVHPNKLEIRFRDERGTRATVDALLTRALAPTVMFDVHAVTAPSIEESVQKTVRYEPSQETVQAMAELNAAPQDMPVENEPAAKQTPPPSLAAQGPATAPTHREAAAESPPVPEGDQLRYVVIKTPESIDEQLNERPPWAEHRPDQPDQMENEPSASSPMRPTETIAIEAEDDVKPHASAPRYRVIGVLANTYLLLELGEALIMIDQHAAHERILYERYVTLLDQQSAAQQLLTPIVVRVTPREMAVLMDNQQLLYEVGYEIDSFGEYDLQVRSVPYVLGEANLKMLFTGLIDQIDRLRSATLEKKRLEIIQFSCKHAVKAGDMLTDAEIDALIQTMQQTGAPPTCPHGRPVLKVMKKNEIERMFKRIQ